MVVNQEIGGLLRLSEFVSYTNASASRWKKYRKLRRDEARMNVFAPRPRSTNGVYSFEHPENRRTDNKPISCFHESPLIESIGSLGRFSSAPCFYRSPQGLCIFGFSVSTGFRSHFSSLCSVRVCSPSHSRTIDFFFT